MFCFYFVSRNQLRPAPIKRPRKVDLNNLSRKQCRLLSANFKEQGGPSNHDGECTLPNKTHTILYSAHYLIIFRISFSFAVKYLFLIFVISVQDISSIEPDRSDPPCPTSICSAFDDFQQHPTEVSQDVENIYIPADVLPEESDEGSCKCLIIIILIIE